MGRWPEALKQMQLALDMEKLSPMYGEDVVYDLFVNRRYEEAARNIGQIVAENPHDVYAQNLRAVTLEAVGKGEESLAAADQAWSLPGNFPRPPLSVESIADKAGQQKPGRS
jgi:Flp pilus assembly protein TadD